MVKHKPYNPIFQYKKILALILLVTLLLFIGEVYLGPSHYSPSQVTNALLHKTGTVSIVVWDIRIPRAIGAILTGLILGMSGLLLQVALRNPLAEPYLLGVSGGATLGVIISLAILPTLGYIAMNIAGFIGAILAVSLVILVGELTGYNVYAVILAGVAVGGMTGSLALVIFITTLQGGRQLGMLWMYGTLSLVGWSEAIQLLVPTALTLLYIALYYKQLNLLLLGDEQAMSMGVNPRSARRGMIIVSTITVGMLTTYTGPIGFIGLMSPHIARMLVGSEVKRLSILTMPVAISLTLLADIMARNLLPSGQEAPLGSMTALLGVPFFLYLLSRRPAET
ncbi:MAG: iron ABC transporter permease [Desulfurococcales archaeon]|nr:iron ABC transporter permease [Desulfurococcales archaeon]